MVEPNFKVQVGTSEALSLHWLESKDYDTLPHFWEEWLKRGMKSYWAEHWPTDTEDLSEVFKQAKVLYAGALNQVYEAVIEWNDFIARIRLAFGDVHVVVGSASTGKEGIEKMLEWIKKLVPASEPPDDDSVHMTFWANGKRGPESIRRKISVPSWEEIRDNYSTKTMTSLDELNNGFRPADGGQLILWHGKPGTGKCGWAESPVRLTDGTQKRHADVKVGDILLGLGHSEVVAVEDNGTRPVYRVRTGAGRELNVTAEHPLLTPEGWIAAKDSLGHAIMVKASHGDGDLTADDGYLLGAMIGDGGLSSDSCSFTNEDAGVILRMKTLVEQKGWQWHQYTAKNRRPIIYGLSKGARAFFGKHGLLNSNAYTKKVPSTVQTANKEAISAFISGLLDTDGYISAKGQYDSHHKERYELSFSTVSKELAEGIQELLARLEVDATVGPKNGMYRGNRHRSWRVTVKKAFLARLLSNLKCYSNKTTRLASWANEVKDSFLMIQDRVISVECIGDLPTIAIQTTSGTYVTGGILTHNTWAIRALVRTWSKWCNAAYITDPEAFFGEASYMMQLLMDLGNEKPTYYPDDDDEDTTKKEDHWNLLILEDTGELLTVDAKKNTGQALSRFLNVVDGLIGQGLRVLVLVTTNEALGNAHDAVSRPGRCAAEVEFASFSKLEASEWISKRKKGVVELPQELTLAELYGLLHGKKKQKKTMGFKT